jgi:transketolase C-terminal domain/subunit
VVLIGQDIAEYGGAFKVTEGMFEQFGAARVRNTPIIESGALGAAMGLAIEGFRPMVEMQFGDFISCGFNQVVNNLAKTHYRWGQGLPVVIRVPVGGGTGAGPYHSQNPEAWFTHVAGLKVVAPATPRDAKGLLLAAFEDGNPVLYLEHKFLYRSTKGPVPEGYYTEPIGPARVARDGSDVTIVTWGVGVTWALDAAERVAEQASVEVIDLRTLLPVGSRSRARVRPQDQPARSCSTKRRSRRFRRRSGRPDRAGCLRLAGCSRDARRRARHARAVQQGAGGDLLAEGTSAHRAGGADRVLTRIRDPQAKKPFIMLEHEHNEQSPATGDVHQRGLERRRRKRTVRSATVGQGLLLDQLRG